MEKDEAAVYRSSDRMDERNEQKQRLQAAFMQRFNSLMEGMSCQGMADRLGVSAAVVWHYSRGSRFPDVTALANIADRLAAQRATDLYAAKIEFDHYKPRSGSQCNAGGKEQTKDARRSNCIDNKTDAGMNWPDAKEKYRLTRHKFWCIIQINSERQLSSTEKHS